MTPADIEAVSVLVKQLEAVEHGGFFNVARLSKMGLVSSRREVLHFPTYSRPSGRTIFNLTAKGHQMLTAGNTLLLQVR